MTKKDKIESLATAMRWSTRGATKNGELVPGGEQYCHFTDNAPKELVDLYLEHYEVRDIDYQTFSAACDIVSEIYADTPEVLNEEATDEIYERASGSASVYTSDALGYLNIWNLDEIGEMVRDFGSDIATACMHWYDKQVEQAAVLIKDWVNA